MKKIAGRLTMTETRRLTSILARVHKKARVPTKGAVREAIKKELASVLGDRPYWKHRLTRLAYANLGLNKAKKHFAANRETGIVLSPTLLMGARNHERTLVKGIPEHDR